MSTQDGATKDDLARFRAAVLADAALQDALQAFDDVDAFIGAARAQAAALGLHVTVEALRDALRGDPIGLARWSGGPPTTTSPQDGWLPINILPQGGETCIDWAYFGERRLSEPFFEDSVRRALRRPLNQLARHRTRLADLVPAMAAAPGLAPDGFIFHMSRCGSTLVAQMLAADPANIVISEASPLDVVVQSDRASPADAAGLHAALLAAIVGALGRRRSAVQARYFVKLDSWHTLALPLFRRVFPTVPWVFLYREPGEVLASQLVQRGIQTVPEYLPPALFGLAAEDSLPADDYCARVLAKTCEAVLPHVEGGGLLVNYSQLPGALWSQILPHFGIASSEADRARMTAAAQFDAKSPSLTFSSDNAAKREVLTDDLRAVADHHIGGIYRALETRRRQYPAGGGG
ncbi:MAG TPA: hypothetical protein VNU97_02805 [Rhizomicrobium sp.]|nr:hypothetical protein [Rhizomicrobium sp.]